MTTETKMILFSNGEKEEMTFEEVRKRFYPNLKKEVRKTNSKYMYDAPETEDYYQELEIELWRAYNGYDPSTGYCFSTYLHYKLLKGTKRATFHRYSQKNQHNGLTSMNAPVGEDDLKLEDTFSDDLDASENIMYNQLLKIIGSAMTDGDDELLLMLVDKKNYPVQVYADKYGVTRQAANQRLMKFKKKLQKIVSKEYLEIA